MELMFVRGSSHLSDQSKIDPLNLSKEQKAEYIKLLVKTKIIQYLNGTVPSKSIDGALDNINFIYFVDCNNNDQKTLLEDIIKYNLFINGISLDNIDTKEILSRI